MILLDQHRFGEQRERGGELLRRADEADTGAAAAAIWLEDDGECPAALGELLVDVGRINSALCQD